MIIMIEGYIRFLRCHEVDTPKYKDITNVLKVVNEINHVSGHIVEDQNEEVATLEAAATERPSTSTALARCGRGQRVATL
ncbi:hypothetical protein SO802_021431 [Lithocarpus litseifolius]|uniref:t-SNARE coiled-coil homology domain-containing protein n=1 Tax=Lithocarpus litseifolius TaxID=425828 RepID=A0AAW2CIC2_9ROSI